MKLPNWGFLLLVAGHLGACQASSSSSPTSSLADVALAGFLDQLPSCGAKCMTTALSSSPCSNATSCICLDHALSDQVTSCVRSSCVFAQQLITKNTTEAFCRRPPRDRSIQYDATTIALCSVSALLVFARIVYKDHFSCHKSLRSDDWMILLAGIVGLACTVLNVVGLTRYGLGKDIWTLAPSDIVNFAWFFFVQQILYMFLMPAVKISLIFFYLYIFPSPPVRRMLWVTMAGLVTYGIIFITVSVFQCTPVKFYWMQYVQDSDGTCFNINLMGWVNGVASVVIDIWIIGIPLSQVRRLELHWKKKIGVAVMFLTGTFVTIVSILRLQALISFYNSDNATWDLWQTAIWSTIEINVAFICACLPTVRLILVHVWPRTFGSAAVKSSLSRSITSSRRPIRKEDIRVQQTDISLDDTPPHKIDAWDTSPMSNSSCFESPRKMETSDYYGQDHWDADAAPVPQRQYWEHPRRMESPDGHREPRHNPGHWDAAAPLSSHQFRATREGNDSHRIKDEERGYYNMI